MTDLEKLSIKQAGLWTEIESLRNEIKNSNFSSIMLVYKEQEILKKEKELSMVVSEVYVTTGWTLSDHVPEPEPEF